VIPVIDSAIGNVSTPKLAITQENSVYTLNDGNHISCRRFIFSFDVSNGSVTSIGSPATILITSQCLFKRSNQILYKTARLKA